MGIAGFTIYYDESHDNSMGELIKILTKDWPILKIVADPPRYIPLLQHNCQNCDPIGLKLDKYKLGKHDLTTIDVRPDLISFTELERRYYGMV